MSDWVNLTSLDAEVMDSIQKILHVREIAHAYAEQPTGNSGDELAISVDEMSNQIDNFRMELAIMVKRSNGVDTEVVGRETDTGIQLP